MAATAVEEALLGHLQKLTISNSEEWASSAGFDHNLVKDVVKSLHGFGYVEAEVGFSFVSLMVSRWCFFVVSILNSGIWVCRP